MKLNQILIISIFLAGIAQAANPANPNQIATQIAYEAGIAQASAGLKEGSLSGVVSGLQAAANADIAETFAMVLNNGPFGRTALSAQFPNITASQLEAIITPVANAMFPGDIITAQSYISQYASTGIMDQNFTDAMNLFETGVSTGNLSDVLQAAQSIANYGPSDKLLARLQYAVTDASLPQDYYAKGSPATPTQGNALADEILAKFNPNQIQQIGTALNLEASDITNLSNLSTFIQTAFTQVPELVKASNATGMTQAIATMKKISPILTEELFQNNEAFDYTALSYGPNGGFTIKDLSTIASAAGLSTSDIASYVTGNYIGGPKINMGGAGGENLGGTPEQQAAYNALNSEIANIKASGMATAQTKLTALVEKIQTLQNQIAEAKQNQEDTSELESELESAKEEALNLGDAIDVINGEDAA